MKKLSSKKGFTLIEMLACVVILILLSMTCGIGMNFAMKSYNSSLFESDSQMLESTVDLFLGDILRHSTSVITELDDYDTEDSGQKLVKTFTNSAYKIYDGYITVTKKTKTEDGIEPQDEAESESGIQTEPGKFLIYKKATDENPTAMLQDSMYAEYLYIEDFILTYNANTGIFKGSYVIKSTTMGSVERECEFAFRRVYN